jgi:hypothetical protein
VLGMELGQLVSYIDLVWDEDVWLAMGMGENCGCI